MKRLSMSSFAAGVLLGALCAISLHGEIAAQDKPDQSTDVTRSPFGIGSCHANNWGAPANASTVNR